MPDPKVEIVGIRELRLGEVLTMSYPGQPVLGMSTTRKFEEVAGCRTWRS